MKHIRKHEEFSQEKRDEIKNQIYLKPKEKSEKEIEQTQHSIYFKTYFYWTPNYDGYDYNYLVDKLSDLDIETTRIGYKYCRIKSKKRILTKLKKIFGNEKVIINNFDKKYSYTIFLLKDDEISKIFEQTQKINK